MPDNTAILVDGVAVTVPVGASVAVAVILAGKNCRRSVTGEARSALCGMGICFECRVTIDGERHLRGCQIPARTGMDVRTDG